MKKRNLALIAGSSYLVIFFAAIFANFFVLESLKQNPMETIQDKNLMVRFGILAFLITAVFDVFVAWALQELYKEHKFTSLSTMFRVMHALIMGLGVYALVAALSAGGAEEITSLTDTFNNIWLIGLFFFGIHLVLLALIIGRPKLIAIFLVLAGVMYMVDTSAHFLMQNYDQHADIFLALVAIPSIGGEMAFAAWLLFHPKNR